MSIPTSTFKPYIPPIVDLQNQVNNAELLYSLVGGKEKFDQLPPYDFLTSWDFSKRYADFHPNSSISIDTSKMTASIMRGINGMPGHEYLVVKYCCGSESRLKYNREEGAILYCNKGEIKESYVEGNRSLSQLICSLGMYSFGRADADTYKKLLTEGKLDELGDWIKLVG